jgi:hypothetical protein
MARDKQPPKTKKYFRPTKSGAGMTKAGTARYRRENPGSKLKTAVTGKVKKGSKAAKRRKSYCARSAGKVKTISDRYCSCNNINIFFKQYDELSIGCRYEHGE